MGIEPKPRDIFDQFLIDFSHEFQVEPYVDSVGGSYDIKADDVYEIQGQYKEERHPINLLVGDPNGKYGLIFVMNDKAATAILDKPAHWGFMYYVQGTAKPLKSLHCKGVIKELMTIRRFNTRTLASSIKRYETYIEEIKKMKAILDESKTSK
jgi:hypothetical protein